MLKSTYRHCKQCSGEFDPIFFRKNDPRANISARARCIGCEQENRDKKKKDNRIKQKARGMIDRHFSKSVERKWVANKTEFIQLYGWNVDHMAHDIEHAYKNGCGYCRRLFSEMGNGLYDLTIDIVDREKQPFYTHNIKYCCQTCNREKGTLSPEQWSLKLAMWDRWERNKKDIIKNPLFGLPLFAEPGLPFLMIFLLCLIV